MVNFKAVIVADPHITFSAYGRLGRDGTNFRTNDFMNAFSWSVDYAINTKATHFFVLGDLFDSPHPINNIRRFLNGRLTALSEAGVKVRILGGNHEFCKMHHALEAIIDLNLFNIKVIEKPESELVEGGENPFLILYFPHHMQIEREEVALRDSFVDFCNKSRLSSKRVHEQGGTTLLFGHFGVFGATRSDNSGNNDIRSVTCEELDKAPSDYNILGDFHIHQVLPTRKNRSMFCGSLERTNSKDIIAPKGLMVFDPNHTVDEVYGKMRFIPYDKVRPFVEIIGSPGEVTEKINAGVPEGAIVKIFCTGLESEIKEFRKTKHLLEARLEEEAKVAYYDFSESVLPDESVQKQIAVLRDEINNRTTIDASDMQGILFARFEAKEPDESERQAIKQEIEDIVKTVNARKKKI